MFGQHFLVLLLIGTALCDEFHFKGKASDGEKPNVVNVLESSRTFWNNKAQNYLKLKLNSKINTNKAKNVIFFLGDGMSISTVAATRMYMGKEEENLSFEEFPHYGLAKTYCTDMTVADSACTAVAYLCGVKTNMRLLGLKSNILSRQCDYSEADHVDSIVGWAQKEGKGTGIVTNTRITHATPAGAYAHVAHRDWEHNNAISSACRGRENVKDIAHQLVHNDVSRKLKVILGGGRRGFINTNELDDEGRPGLRTDGRNLINEWIEERNLQGKAEYIWHKQQLDEINVNETDFLLGLFEHDHLLYNLDIMNGDLHHQEPTLTDLTVKAIKMLQKEKNGFFLLVEGGKIDHAHHANRQILAMDETKEFSRAIDIARQMTDEADTLIVVSSDHSHVTTFNGYPHRGSNVNGIAEVTDEDGFPYETLSYANGPGSDATYNAEGTGRVDITNLDFKNPLRRSSATVPLSSETHAGEDVGVFASGPWSHLFAGNYEQSNIPVAMAYAAKIGMFAEESEEPTDIPDTTDANTTTTDSADSRTISAFALFVALLIRALGNQILF